MARHSLARRYCCRLRIQSRVPETFRQCLRIQRAQTNQLKYIFADQQSSFKCLALGAVRTIAQQLVFIARADGPGEYCQVWILTPHPL